MHCFDETNRFGDLTTRNTPTIVASECLQYDRKLTHDVYARHRCTEQLTAYAGVNNVTDEKPDVGETSIPSAGWVDTCMRGSSSRFDSRAV